MKPRAKLLPERWRGDRKYLVTDEKGSYYYSEGYRLIRQPPKDWRDEIRIGDVLRLKNDDFRVVRYCKYKQNGLLACIGFAIRRCSWTTRCYTILTRADIRTFGYSPTHIKVKFKDAFDLQINEEIYKSHHNIKITCCDVRAAALA